MMESGIQLKQADADITGRIIGLFYDVYNELRYRFLEVKSAPILEAAYQAQRLRYPRSAQIEVGWLLNLSQRPQFRRFLFDNERKTTPVNSCKSVAQVSA